MDKHRKDLLAMHVIPLTLFSPRLSFYNRVNRLEMARIRQEAHVDRAPLFVDKIGTETKVVFYITAPAHLMGQGFIFKGRKNLFRGLSHQVCQYVEPPPMGHPDHDLPDSQIKSRRIDQLMERRYERLPPFEGEPLLADITGLDEPFELLGLYQIGGNSLFDLGAEIRSVVTLLKPLDQPTSHGFVLDMEDLHTDMTAVGLLERFDNLPQGSARRRHVSTGPELYGQVIVGQAKSFGLELSVSTLNRFCQIPKLRR